MDKYLCIDIETIPFQSLPEGTMPEFDPESVKMGNIKDETKRAEKVAEAKAQFEAGLVKQMSLDPDLCEVIMVAILKEGDYLMESYGPYITEYERIYETWSLIAAAYQSRIPLVTYNGMGFDLPILLHAAIRLDVAVSPFMYSALTQKYNNPHHYDLMQWFSSWDRQKWKPLDFYLKLFDIGAKTSDGSQVYDMWKAGEHDKIREYCEQDVLMTARLFERVSPWIVKEVEVYEIDKK